MRMLKGILAITVAAAFGGLVLTSAIWDVAVLFTDFSWSMLGWTLAACATVCGAGVGYLYFTEPKAK
jgi:hypothetical protein